MIDLEVTKKLRSNWKKANYTLFYCQKKKARSPISWGIGHDVLHFWILPYSNNLFYRLLISDYLFNFVEKYYPMIKERWTREELILVLSLYFQLPFGRLNQRTPEVRNLAAIMGRSNNSVAMRLANFAACDPYILNSGRKGLQAGVKVCQPVWNEFYDNRQQLFIEAETIKASMQNLSIEENLGVSSEELKGTTRETVIKQRVNQYVFREMILNNYEHRCAITGLDLPELLVASHIIPWSCDEDKRLDPENGICLSPLYDKAFDKGLIGITPDYEVRISNELKAHSNKSYYQTLFAPIDKMQIHLPLEHLPNPAFLEYHLQYIFAKHQ